MNLRASILEEHSKEMAMKVVAYVGESQDRLAEVLTLAEDREVKLAQRASWPLSYIFDAHPEMINPNVPRMLKLLDEPVHDAIPRAVLRAFAQVPKLPEDYWGEILEVAYEKLQNPKVPVAIRVHCMQIIFNVSRFIPELGEELKLILETQMTEASAGFQSRARKLIKKLS